jgi:hypothetical protein
MNEPSAKPAKTPFELLQRWKQKVIDLVIQGETPTAACRKVKSKSRRPDLIASKLKKESLYLEALEQRRSDAMEDAGITNAQILLDIAQLANVNPKALVWCEGEPRPEGAVVGQRKKLHELDDVTARCIQALEFSHDGELKARFPDRLAAKKLLGQYKRMFTESHEINLGEKTLEQLLEASWNRPRPDTPPDDVPPAAGL